jgi:hypothetical protein
MQDVNPNAPAPSHRTHTIPLSELLSYTSDNTKFLLAYTKFFTYSQRPKFPQIYSTWQHIDGAVRAHSKYLMRLLPITFPSRCNATNLSAKHYTNVILNFYLFSKTSFGIRSRISKLSSHRTSNVNAWKIAQNYGSIQWQDADLRLTSMS